MSLDMIENGKRVRLVELLGGAGLQSRLTSLGFVPGTELTMVRNDRRGPVVVCVKDSRIMLGRGMAHKIRVAPA